MSGSYAWCGACGHTHESRETCPKGWVRSLYQMVYVPPDFEPAMPFLPNPSKVDNHIHVHIHVDNKTRSENELAKILSDKMLKSVRMQGTV